MIKNASYFTANFILSLLLFILQDQRHLRVESLAMVSTPKHRIELFFKTPEDLRERIRFLKSHGFDAYNLVNKNQKDTVEEWVRCILDEHPDADVCAHYSLKYNKVALKGIPEHSQRLQTFATDTQASDILLISGSGKTTGGWNTVKALQTIYSTKGTNIKVSVAYNPYFPNPVDQAQEDERLNQKLSSGEIRKVYLQFGTDLVRLKQALQWLEDKDVEIAGSVFLPTGRLIAQQKFRPWNGVFLSKDFLAGPDTAYSIVVELLKLYRTYNVEMLWEAPGIRTEKDLNILLRLSAESDDKTGDESMQKREGAVLQQHPTVGADEKITIEGIERQTQIKRPKLDKKCSPDTCLLLFGSHDVRLRDNRAVELALCQHERVVPVFLWTPQGKWGVTGALEVVLQEAVLSLESSLDRFDLKLVCRNCKDDDGTEELEEIAKETKATTVYWNREHTTESRSVEQSRRRALEEKGVTVVASQSSLLYDPELIELDAGFHGGHWGTLMPFLKNCKKCHGEPRRPTPYHETFRLLQQAKGPSVWPSLVPVKNLNIAIVKGNERWDEPIRSRFPIGEKHAMEALDQFFQKGLRRYESERSRADKELTTSKLSPHLRLGTISPNELYWRTEDSGIRYEELKTFSRRLFWRDLAYFQLKCFPDMRSTPIRTHYKNMEWVIGDEEKRRFEAWKFGKTGFPIVDAGMRELYATGWMTQSVRMVVASFLVEYLRVSWVRGCEWFHYTLVDADSAINAMMWNNAGKSGIDQWNFVLSPITASQDPSGEYTRKWVPELAALPTAAALHRPWEAPKEALEWAGIVLGGTYPHRILLNLKEERAKGLESTLDMRRKSQNLNTERGYDLIHLPDGKKTVVFTKKEYRIDGEGNLMTGAPPKLGKSKRKGRTPKETEVEYSKVGE